MLYDQLAQSNFITTYASTNALEDFAESFSFYLMSQEPGFSFQIRYDQSSVYDPVERLMRDPLMKSKLDFIENFLKSDFKYPDLYPK